MRIKSLIIDSCPSCNVPTITSNFAIMATAEILEPQSNDLRPRILLMIHCDLCGKKFQGKLDSVDFTQIG